MGGRAMRTYQDCIDAFKNASREPSPADIATGITGTVKCTDKVTTTDPETVTALDNMFATASDTGDTLMGQRCG